MAMSTNPEKPAKRSTRDNARTGAIVVLAVIATLFAVLNTESVEVNWIFGSGHAPLIVGIVLTYMAERLSRRRKSN